ncbi:energy-coupling factor ABC transporter ATP-binding protein [Falsirhodobacter sp. 20TX0035]|uniref:energy-coupling factor ABC transporter ATP-binding protein n=1 Tax=Falsirhodobacter sp. 20TX0035 TaxID=3022019 RepID=UPI002330DDB5|nr:ABC transporter ATP-binding protein [Falsirhodobacter sp. 20TX0035]MDB6452184.1 ABC transporter ATP-binding protein [Falsirhodobacter sp. 20TX0035]
MNGIHLEQAGVVLQGRTLLQPMTLHLSERRIAILGRNGAGKTTFLRLLAGLQPPTTGTVKVEGADPADRRAMLGAIGILFQSPDHQIIFPTVEEELGFGLRQMNHPDPAGAVRALLQAEGRADWAERPVQSLSQGQKQYLCLMAVLLMAPKTILLDEPFAALDLPTRMALQRRLAALPQRLVTITHDPASVHGADRVLWLEEGRIVADGPPDAVLPPFLVEMERLGRE